MSILQRMRAVFAYSMARDAELQMLEDKCTALAWDAAHLQELRQAAGLIPTTQPAKEIEG